eukprot:TRINITY_DN5957_c0_g1_i1.p1 TRINITY_DN5957_c0_g1~~TRINITY_DN5957_c0_g1_i1.p1  ORF type:complete len:296 (-),score=30.98 TRINITY_DN5957_c0_g1_i1:192-1079(-)
MAAPMMLPTLPGHANRPGFTTWSFLGRSPDQDTNLVVMLDVPSGIRLDQLDLNMDAFIQSLHTILESDPGFFSRDRQRPADPAAVEALPEAIITQEVLDHHTSCAVCLSEFAAEESDVLAMPCEHLFHKNCLTPWLERRHTCPVCRTKLATTTPSQQPANALRELFADLAQRLTGPDSDVRPEDNSRLAIFRSPSISLPQLLGRSPPAANPASSVPASDVTPPQPPQPSLEAIRHLMERHMGRTPPRAGSVAVPPVTPPRPAPLRPEPAARPLAGLLDISSIVGRTAELQASVNR